MLTYAAGLLRRRDVLWTAQAAIAAALIWILFRSFDLGQVFGSVWRAKPGLLALALLALVFERVLRPYRLALLLGATARIVDVIAIQSFSQLVNLVLPMRSGEIALVFMLRDIAPSASFAASIVAIDRLLDLACVLLIFAASIVAVAAQLPAYAGQAAIALGAICAAGFAAMLAAALAKATLLRWADRLVFSRLPSAAQAGLWRERLALILDGFGVLLNPLRLALAVLATAAAWGAAVLATWFILAAFWPEPPLGAAALAIALTAIGVSLISAPAGIGVAHAAFALAAVAFGASYEIGLAYAILGHFLSVSVTAAMGLASLSAVKRAGLTQFGFWKRT